MNLLPSKKNKKALAIVLLVSLVFHFLVLLAFGTVKFVVELVGEESVFEVAPVETPPQLKPEYIVNIEPEKPTEPDIRRLKILPESSVAIDIPEFGIDVEFENQKPVETATEIAE